MSATGCTYGKLMMERLGYGKMAMVLHEPGKGTVRVYLRSEFQDELAGQEFFDYRKQGVEPSDIPSEVTGRAVGAVLGATEEKMFSISRLPDFAFGRPKGSFAKVKCSRCGEYVFERYARNAGGKVLCIPSSGYTEPRLDPLKGEQYRRAKRTLPLLRPPFPSSSSRSSSRCSVRAGARSTLLLCF